MHHPDLAHGLHDGLRLAVGIPEAAVAMQYNDADASATQILLQAATHDD